MTKMRKARLDSIQTLELREGHYTLSAKWVKEIAVHNLSQSYPKGVTPPPLAKSNGLDPNEMVKEVKRTNR